MLYLITFIFVIKIIFSESLSTSPPRFKSKEYAAIENLNVLNVNGDSVRINSLWNSNEKALMVLFRSFG